MMLLELINKLEDIYAAEGNMPVKFCDNDYMRLLDFKLTVYAKGDHVFDHKLDKFLEVDSE